ncbi:MAG: Bug family tripartite tricarboxylate transporter substrate binding protein [Burkholderiales bacterium]
MTHARIAIIAALGWVVSPDAAQSQQAFPTKPVRMVVAFTAGSETDFFARIVGQKLSEGWGQQVVVDNRPGAAGTLASGIVAAAPTDGYTLIMHSMAHAVAPAVYAKLPYDTLRDFAGISEVAGVPNVLVIAPAHGVRSVKELIALARQKPAEITFGSAGVGSGMHINGEQFKLAAGINVTHVPYKGGPEALTDAVAGRTYFVFSPMGIGLPLIKDRRLVALAVSTASRSPALPDVPTVAEAALPGFAFDTWYGVLAPAKTPRPIVNQVSREISRILALADVKERFAVRGAVPKSSTPEQFERFVRSEVEKLGKIVRAAGVKAE